MKLTRTLILVLALAGSAYAGNIQNGVATPPPQQQTQTAEPVATPESTETTETAETASQAPTMTEIVLTVVSILGLI